MILDLFWDECFIVMFGGGVKLNGLFMKVGEESIVLEVVVVIGYVFMDVLIDVMFKGMIGKYVFVCC